MITRWSTWPISQIGSNCSRLLWHLDCFNGNENVTWEMSGNEWRSLIFYGRCLWVSGVKLEMFPLVFSLNEKTLLMDSNTTSQTKCSCVDVWKRKWWRRKIPSYPIYHNMIASFVDVKLSSIRVLDGSYQLVISWNKNKRVRQKNKPLVPSLISY